MNQWIAGVDVGNTRIKIALFENNVLKKIVFIPSVIPERITPYLSEFPAIAGGGLVQWVIAGVVPQVISVVQGILEKAGFRARVLKDPSCLGLKLNLSQPGQVGIDRVLACLGAFRRTRGESALVVDSGTALTINLVNGTGVFQGGSIQPGWRLMARSLGEGTARLPEIGDPEIQVSPWPGKDTFEAIRAGLEMALVASVKTRWDQVRRIHPEASLWLTGGGGEWLEKALEGQGTFNPHLVLEGMVHAVTSHIHE